jgi:2-polyprenyl-3-methyl-5-hydroxy-6-metoxy-1,4-benzoquinol methylase
MNTLYQHLDAPPLFQRSAVNFWDDEHISGYLLEAHLDPDFEGASRKRETIEKSVQWITALAPPCEYPSLLDVGSGPGIYSELFATEGYQVTGIDFSKRSIAYARDSAAEHGLKIAYHYQNYLEMNFASQFDIATFIYCDYGALPEEEGKTILGKIHAGLKKGGRLVFDVFSMERYSRLEESRTWERYAEGGFWHAEDHHVLQANLKYPPQTSLEQYIVATPEKSNAFYIWNRYFTAEQLIQEVEDAGFSHVGLFDNITGCAYTGKSPTLAILVQKV